MITPEAIAAVLNAVAQLGICAAISLGVFVAYKQMNALRTERVRNRRSELSEEMLVLCEQLLDAFKHIRNPFGSIPKDKLNDPEFVYKERYERINDANDLFKALRELQIRCDAVIETNLAPYVTELFNVRSEISWAIDDLLDLDRSERSDRYREEWKAARFVLYGRWNEADETGSKIIQNLNGIRSELKQHKGH